MQNCLGIYIESNLIKYAKVSKEKTDFKVESYGIEFFEDITTSISKIIEETFSFSTPISINLSNERYLYFDIFSLLSKSDIEKTIQTEYETFCDENKYNQKAFETRYALVPSVENKEKIKAIQVLANKIELNKQKQYLDKYKLSKILPIGTAIASIINVDKKENALIVNMEDKTTITTIYDRKIYNVETVENGSQEILEKINVVENSMSKAYEICKNTTIYTAQVIEEAKEQPYLENIVTTIYQICQRVQEIISESPLKIDTVYLTGTLSVVNNIDLYFQELLPTADCKILRPGIIEESSTNVNIKDYIEVNSAIALAMQALGEGVQALNFKKASALDQVKKILNTDVSSFGKQVEKKKKRSLPSININFSMKGELDKTETILLRFLVAIILIDIIFMVFSKALYKQLDNKEQEVQEMIAEQKDEINKVDKDTTSLNTKDNIYRQWIEDLKSINDKINNITKLRNTIPNLLNQIMYVIPEEVQITRIQHMEELTSEGNRKVQIYARATDYDQLGYFIAKLKVEKYLNNVISSGSKKNGDVVDVIIEGELP